MSDCVIKSRNVRRWYVSKYGPVPSNKLLCHKCNNPCCHNIDHIYLGSLSDNFRDYMEQLEGYPHPNSYLTREEILQIRASKELWRMLALKYKVSYYTIQHIKRGETYRHVK